MVLCCQFLLLIVLLWLAVCALNCLSMLDCLCCRLPMAGIHLHNHTFCACLFPILPIYSYSTELIHSYPPPSILYLSPLSPNLPAPVLLYTLAYVPIYLLLYDIYRVLYHIYPLLYHIFPRLYHIYLLLYPIYPLLYHIYRLLYHIYLLLYPIYPSRHRIALSPYELLNSNFTNLISAPSHAIALSN